MDDDLPIDPVIVDARGMRCPWPVLRAERALRIAHAVKIIADDPIADGELAALAQARDWRFVRLTGIQFMLWKQ
ncbi:sulfurtransferase TusA family protein [Sphingobium subterraneum]|uniref:tRNA 2-thiouridine synthesizing protein A n=1 Tax=Sphingobium subterraneum TaxID=627688 RepID=A0A841J9J3_9SPHN|nr:sulfurtransferase TusA family protein [Sphingobium subterraneum]MBB6124821.1 tRNA 2-thiouridine synthesizing protein A [Sphingobium subterraneum]